MPQGGLLDLVALGQQDTFTVGNPQVTFFKSMHKRHTNFTTEMVENTMEGNVAFGKQCSAKIQRVGDLIKEIYLKIKLPSVVPSAGSKFAWVKRLGFYMIDDVYIDIGGTSIDKHYGHFLNIWYELARCPGKKEKGLLRMIGDIPALTSYTSTPKPAKTLYVPLSFWFNKNSGLALPLIALQYHEVFLRVKFLEARKLIVCNKHFLDNDLSQVVIQDAVVMCNYVYCDSKERRRFAQTGHEYLIDQLQYSGSISAQNKSLKQTLTFNHPVKELLWAMNLANYTEGKAFLCYTGDDVWQTCGECNVVTQCAQKVLGESIALLNAAILGGTTTPADPAPTPGVWESFNPGVTGETLNGLIQVTNNSTNKILWVNTNSLNVGGSYSLTGQISASIVVSATNIVTVSNVSSTLTLRDLSFPVEKMIDTRYKRDDPLVYQHHNYGVLIDGTENPFSAVLLQFNGTDRFSKQEGEYFSDVQPHQHHTNTPADGICAYVFALHPENQQPSGSANFSRIDSATLSFEFADPTLTTGLQDLGFLTANNKLYIFARNINVFRIIAGMGGVAYSS